ncbi:MAG TPA: translocation/assembly module TamB domain-containing protein [Candidatus Sulfotelmatobacter sp.]|nr:translocation/assembly module TamB domain-containing protein [Candidatus Sulfotelmatobacter sp.]
MNLKRRIAWAVAGLVALLILAGMAGYFYLRSNSFQQYALSKIVQQADIATGGHTQIGGLDFSLSTLTAHLYNITLRGTEGPDQPPLLHADQLTVRLKIVSALHRQVNLRELLVDHPVVHLQVSRDGKTNLPAAPPSQNNGNTSVFDLAVGHVQLNNGEVNYNDRKTPLDADLYNLGTDIRFESLAKRYEGVISYDNGHVKYAQYAALPHNLKLKFSATPERLNFDSAVLNLGASSVSLHASVSDYANPVADGGYQIQIHTQDFAAMSPQAAPAGDISLTGQLHYQAVTNQPLLRNISINGKLASEVLSAVASGNRLELRRLQGTYQLANGNLVLKNVALASFGGSISADAEIKHLDTTQDSQVQALVHNISLGALQRAFQTQGTEAGRVSGSVSGKVEASWQGSLANLRGHSDLALHALASSKSDSARTVPVNGAIHAAYDGTRETISLRDTTLRIPSATLTAQGTISDHSRLQLNIAATDLHQLAVLASSFGKSQTRVPAVSGSATLNAVVSGSMKKPAVTAELSAQNLQVEGSQWTTASLQMHANPSQFSVQSGSLVSAQQGRATFSANVALRNWSYANTNLLEAHLDVQRVRIADLQRLANQNYPVSGDLSAKVSLSGSQVNPVGSGSAQITNAIAYNEAIQNFAANFNAANGSIVSTLNLAVAAGALDANLSYTPKTKAYKVHLNAPAVALQKLQAVKAKDLNLTGTVTASVSGEGTLDDPQLTASVQLPQLSLQQNLISGLNAQLDVAHHYANIDLSSNVSAASIHAHGRVALTGGYYTEAAIDTNTIPLDALVAAYAPSVPKGFQGHAELHATLKGPLKDKSQVEAHLSIPVLSASYQSLQIGINSPIRADYANSVVTLQPAEIRGTGTSLHLQGRLPIGGTAPPTLSANGSIDVSVLKIVAPDLESAGTVALDVHASGSTANSTLAGQLQFKDIALNTADAPIGVEKLNGAMDITSDRVQLSHMTAQVGGGQVTLGGSVTYKPDLHFELAIQGKSVRLRYPQGLRSLLDANLAFSGTTQASILNGRVLIDNLSFTPDFDLASFGDQFSTGGAPAQPGFADTIKLAIGVQSQGDLNARSSQVSIAGQAALQVSGTAANPVITGRTTLTSGELFYRNLRYQLQKGVITFNDPNETHPVLNVSVGTIVEQYNLTLTMRGPLDKLTTSYVSDPPLATADIINLIARGKTTQESAASSQSTDSMIASQAASEVSSSVQKLAGISSLEIDPMMGGNNQNPSARIALQQRVTKNLLFTFSTDVSQPGAEIVQGEYQLTKRWSVSTERDQLGGISVDGRFHTRF